MVEISDSNKNCTKNCKIKKTKKTIENLDIDNHAKDMIKHSYKLFIDSSCKPECIDCLKEYDNHKYMSRTEFLDAELKKDLDELLKDKRIPDYMLKNIYNSLILK